MVSAIPRAVGLAGLLLLAACARTPPPPEVIREPQPVPMPYPVIVLPTEELMQGAPTVALPRFIKPDAPGAVSCLDQAGVDAVREVTIALRSQLDAWETWGRSLYKSRALEERSK